MVLSSYDVVCYNQQVMSNSREQIHTPEIGFNLASDLPRILIPGQVEALTERLAEDGYQFASALPLRTVVDGGGNVTGCNLPIWYLEDAWNPTKGAGLAGLMEFVRGIATKDPLAPQIHDFIAFPDKERADGLFRKMVTRLNLTERPPTVVVHHLNGLAEFNWGLATTGVTADTILELNPGMLDAQGELLSPESLLETLAYPASSILAGVDLDTRHIRRGLRPDETAKTVSRPDSPTKNALGAWQGTVQQFIAHTRLLDFQGMAPRELFDTINGQQTELAEVVLAAKEAGYRGPVRVEFNLGLGNQIKPGVVEDVAKDVYDYLAEAMR